MSEKVVHFPGRPTAEQVVAKVRELAPVGISHTIVFDHPHTKARMLERKLNMRQVLEVIRKGVPVGEPKLDEWGDWRIKLKHLVAGRRVQVVVAVKSDRMVVVTVI